jgi:hypothetical protein
MSAYRRLPVLDKMRYARLSAPPALFRCRLCGVKVLGRDQAGHTTRAHAGASHGWDMVTT